jgi:hypothetical protein
VIESLREIAPRGPFWDCNVYGKVVCAEIWSFEGGVSGVDLIVNFNADGSSKGRNG